MLTTRFEDAVRYANIVHAHKKRKSGSEAPYMAHLLGVTAIALEYGADEDETIGALLHDAVEDVGGRPRLADIRARYGKKVAEIVEGCSDSLGDKDDEKLSWRERKAAYVAHVPKTSGSVRLVSAADKLNNVRAIVVEYRRSGEKIWKHYKGSREDRLWYYRALVKAYRKSGTHKTLVEDLDEVVSELERLLRPKR